MLISLQQLEEGETFLTQSLYEVAQGRHASRKLLDVFDAGWAFHPSDDQDFLRVHLDPSSTDVVTQNDTRWDTKYALGGIQFPSVFFKGFELLLEVSDKVIGGL